MTDPHTSDPATEPDADPPEGPSADRDSTPTRNMSSPPQRPKPSRSGGATVWAKAKPAVALVLVFVAGLLVGVPMGGAGEGSSGAAPAGSAEHAGHGGKSQVWTCAMHPQIKLPDPGKCPICGMELIPLDSGGDEEEHGDSPRHVVMSRRAQKLAEIRTVAVRRADATVELRLLGRLAYDETKVRTITSWTDGRIDRLLVSAIGEKIKRGQVIASQYSPEVYAAQVDLIQAKLQIDRLDKALPIARTAAEATMESARTRLKLLGIKPMSSKRISSSSRPSRNVAITAKYSGTVVEQMVYEGAYVKAGTPIFRTANLSKIWAQLDAYESDLAKVHLGQKVTLVISSFPSETFKGKVAFVDPVLDPRTRTAQIRVEIKNKKGRLSPGMFADAVIHASDEKRKQPPLVIPDSAPLFTGKRSVVYIELPSAKKPTYEVRVVQLGPKAGNVYPVIAGVEEGERVVTQGAFSLDSDLQIKGGESMMSFDDDGAREARQPVRVTKKFMAGLAPVVEAYLNVHKLLSTDDAKGAAEALAVLARQSAGFDPLSPDQAREVYLELREKISAEARQGANTDDLVVMRRVMGSIARPFVIAMVRFGNPTDAPLRMAFCPMAFDGRGGHWLQRAEKVENPYFGAAMFTCGEIQGTAQPGARLTSHAIMKLKPKRKGAANKGHAGH